MDSCEKGIFYNNILDNGVCKACPMGLYGFNCSLICPFGYYGQQCLQICNCSIGQFCHPAYGCGLLTTNGTFYPIGDIEEKESCDKAIAISLSVCIGIFVILSLIHMMCCHKGRFNVRDALRRKLENIASEVYVDFEQRRQVQEAADTGQNNYTYQRNSYAEIESSLTQKPTNDYSELCLEAITVQSSSSRITNVISTNIAIPDFITDGNSGVEKLQLDENEAELKKSLLSSTAELDKDHVAETDDNQYEVEQNRKTISLDTTSSTMEDDKDSSEDIKL